MNAPVLWHRLSGGSRRQVERHQRAHGDGLEIDLDTPEAFEEVVWKMGWPDKYRDGGITPWTADDRRPRYLAGPSRSRQRAWPSSPLQLPPSSYEAVARAPLQPRVTPNSLSVVT